jgi:uncharacterized protein (TIGR02453 family)
MTTETLDFLLSLGQNNNREWFEKNKPTYEKVYKKEFTPFIQNLIDEVKKFDPSVNDLAKDSLFRIYRDVRFSKDKSPYKDYFSASISKGGKKNPDYPGYYLQLSGGMLMIGGGAYFLEKDKLFKARQHILTHQDTFLELIQEQNFITHFEAVKGEKNVRIEPEFKAIADKVPLIMNKQFYVMAELDPNLAIGQDAVKAVAKYCEVMKPFNDFFAEAAFV